MMRRRGRFLSALVAAAALAACAASCGGCAPSAERECLFQVSTIGALVEGVYDGTVTIGNLKKHGALGIGTFDALDGEMVLVDGRAYRVRADGKAEGAADGDSTPFATVTFFEADHTGSIEGAYDLAALEGLLDRLLPTKNVPCAVRLEGTFARVKTRSVPRQTRPYPRLAVVTAQQPTFEFADMRGTVVGFRCPAWMGGLNVPGWHLHFLTEDRTAGGHVLELTVERVLLSMDSCAALHVALPTGGAFWAADLSAEERPALERIEK